MGAVTPLLGGLTTAAGIASTGLGLANKIGGFGAQERKEDLKLDQLRQQQALQEAQIAQDAALDRQEIAVKAAQDEAERRDALRRAVARQRARFGASGLDTSTGGGSAEAVLLGLLGESEAQAAERDALDALRLQAIDDNAAQKSSLNLLQATQLSQKNALNDGLVGRLF